LALCIYCSNDFGQASSIVCLHCGAPLQALKKEPDKPFTQTRTRLSINARRIVELLDNVPASAPPPNARAISAALEIDWGETHRLLELLQENRLIVSIVSSERGSQYSITLRGKAFL
jgi:hypothetical protein